MESSSRTHLRHRPRRAPAPLNQEIGRRAWFLAWDMKLSYHQMNVLIFLEVRGSRAFSLASVGDRGRTRSNLPPSFLRFLSSQFLPRQLPISFLVRRSKVVKSKAKQHHLKGSRINTEDKQTNPRCRWRGEQNRNKTKTKERVQTAGDSQNNALLQSSTSPFLATHFKHQTLSTRTLPAPEIFDNTSLLISSRSLKYLDTSSELRKTTFTPPRSDEVDSSRTVWLG